MPKSAYALVARTRRQVKNTKPREAILGDGNGNIYANGQYYVRFRGPADENGNPTYGPVSRAFGGQVNFLEKPNRHVYVEPNHKGQPVITGPVWEDLQQAGITPSIIHPNTPYRGFQRLKDIQNFKAVIINPDGFKIAIRELAYIDGRDGSLQIWLGTDEGNHVDLEASVPVAVGYHCYALISFDQDLQAASSYPLVITTSTPKASTTALNAADRQEAYDAAPVDSMPVMFFRLVNGMPGMGIGDPYDIDFRQLVNVPGVRNESVTLEKLAPGTPGKVIGFDGSGDPVELDNGQYYQTLQENDVDVTQRGKLNFKDSASVTVNITDNSGDNSTDIEFTAITGSGTDTDAVHVNVAGEIAAITTATPASGDYLLMEDVSDSNNKKKITVGSLGAATQTYPANAEMNHRLSHVLTGTAIVTLGTVTGNPPGQNAAAVNDAWQNRFFMAAGSYTLEMFGVTGPNRGIATVEIDGASQGTVDWYTVSDAIATKTLAVTVLTDGNHILKVTMATKHGSSSGFFLPLWGMTLY